jgi:hypothetical protein
MSSASPLNLQDYRDAVSGKGPRAYDWEDKPHRLIYDLCGEIEILRAHLTEAAASYTHARRLAQAEPDENALARWRSALPPVTPAPSPLPPSA